MAMELGLDAEELAPIAMAKVFAAEELAPRQWSYQQWRQQRSRARWSSCRQHWHCCRGRQTGGAIGVGGSEGTKVDGGTNEGAVSIGNNNLIAGASDVGNGDFSCVGAESDLIGACGGGLRADGHGVGVGGG